MSDKEVLNAKTLVDLALIGFVANRAQTGSVLIARIKQAGGDHFTPTADFIRDRLLSLISGGQIAHRDDSEEPRYQSGLGDSPSWERLMQNQRAHASAASSFDDAGTLEITAAGRIQVMRLLRLELDPSAAVLRTVCATMKLCLLDLVDAETRGEIICTLWCSRDGCPTSASPQELTACPLMTRYLAIEQKRRAEEKRFWQDTLLEEGLLDPTH